jgi:hypothetical protein
VRRIFRIGGFARGEGGKFGGHGLAEHDGAGGAGERDAGGIGRRPATAIDRGPVRGRHVGGVDQVLDRDRHAVQRPARRLGVAPAGLGERLFAVEMFKGADDGLAGGDTGEIGGGERLGFKAPLGDLASGGAGGKRSRIGHKRHPQTMPPT